MSSKTTSPSELEMECDSSSTGLALLEDEQTVAGTGDLLGGPDSKDLRVLIVEDSAIVRGRLVRLVAGVPGVSVVGMAVDGTHALALVHEFQPDAVILDIQLPGLDGIELLARLRAERSLCKVVILTTYAFDEFRRKTLDLGAEFFFDKAMEFPRVVEVLGNMVKRKQSQRLMTRRNHA